MAITRYAGDRFCGLDSEKNTLLSQVIDGAQFTASDTLITYIKVDGYWLTSSGSSGSAGSIGSKKSKSRAAIMPAL